MDAVSRDIMRAVLKSRDQRHNETHAMLVAMFQSLVVEMVEQGAINPAALAQRLALTQAHIEADPNGTVGRHMLDHVTGWLNTIQPGLPPPHPERWRAPDQSGSAE